VQAVRTPSSVEGTALGKMII
jgi:hypothetical protein